MAERVRPHPGAGAVLALDLGTHTGFACRHVDGAIRSGAVKFDARGGCGYRYARLRKWLTDFKNAAGGLDALWYEDCPFTRPGDSQAPRLYGGFEATVTCWCEHHGIPYTAINTSTIKKFITGKGRGHENPKAAVMEAVRALGYDPATHDEADALALLMLALERMECGRAA